jgi:hypothetical protein
MSWRDLMPVHPAADIFPMMPDDELLALGEDIKRNGLTSPIAIMIENAKPVLLDGRNRLAAMEHVGLRVDLVEMNRGWCAEAKELLADGTVVLHGFEDSVAVITSDPAEYVASVNIHRRHLDSETKRKLAANLLKENPQRSDRAVGELAKVDHKTVGAVRRDLEASGDVPQLTNRTAKTA